MLTLPFTVDKKTLDMVSLSILATSMASRMLSAQPWAISVSASGLSQSVVQVCCNDRSEDLYYASSQYRRPILGSGTPSSYIGQRAANTAWPFSYPKGKESRYFSGI